MKKERICVYTCITGEYEHLQEISLKERGLDYYCFTNNKNIKSETWKVIYIEDESLTNVQLARKTKILGHPIVNEYDIAIWVDGSVKFIRPIKEFLETYFTKKDIFSCFKHAVRNNIKDECYECVRKRKEKKEKVKKLLSFYSKEKYYFDNGLIESTVYIKRPKNQKVIETMNLWFDMILNYTHRDQLSFNYCIFKTKMQVHWIDLNVFHNNWFQCQAHGKEKEISSYRVYFDDEIEYNIDHDFSGQMKKKGDNIYSIRLKVPCDTKKTVIELSKIPFIQLSYLKINDFKKLKIHYFNAIEDEKILFVNENPAFEIYNSLKKSDVITITMKLDTLSGMVSDETMSMIQYLGEKYNELNNENHIIKNQNKNITNQIKQLKKRKIWKFISFFDKIFEKRKGK